MNFNQLDLIKFKEYLQKKGVINEKEFAAITRFCTELIDFNMATELVKKDVFGEQFLAKQNLINAAGQFINATKEVNN